MHPASWPHESQVLCLTAEDLSDFDSDHSNGGAVGRTYERALRSHMPRRMVPVPVGSARCGRATARQPCLLRQALHTHTLRLARCTVPRLWVPPTQH